jgi:hypothetical protein
MLETEPARRARSFDGTTTLDPVPIDFELDWEPRPLARAIRSGRRFRWPVLVTAALLAAATSAGWILGLQFMDDHAARRGVVYRVAAADAGAAIDDAQEAAGVITDAGSGRTAVTAAVEPLSRLETISARLDDATAARLLELPDPVPTPRLDDLAAARDRLARISSSIDTLTGRLRTVADYRAGVGSIITLPRLPSPENPFTAAEAQDALGASLADGISALGDLPDEPLLAAHRDRIADHLVWLGDWQGRYLALLQAGDLAGAQVAERRARERIDVLRLGLLAPLAELDRWASDLLASMERAASEARILSS